MVIYIYSKYAIICIIMINNLIQGGILDAINQKSIDQTSDN